MKIVGYILLAIGVVTAFGNLTGGGAVVPQNRNARLITALVIAAIGAWLAFG